MRIMAGEVSRGDILAPHGWPARVESETAGGVLTIQSLTVKEVTNVPLETLRTLELSDVAKQRLGEVSGFLSLLESEVA